MSLLEKRLLISYYYVKVMNAPAPEHWKGWDGTIVEILRGLDMTNDGYRKVESVISQTYKCLLEKRRYMGHIQWKGGRSNFIQPGSEEEQMIAQYKEQHCSFTEVKDFINDRRMRLGYEEDDAVTRSAVYSAYKKWPR